MTWRRRVGLLLLAGLLLCAAGCPRRTPMHVYPPIPHDVEVRNGAVPVPR